MAIIPVCTSAEPKLWVRSHCLFVAKPSSSLGYLDEKKPSKPKVNLTPGSARIAGSADDVRAQIEALEALE